jgi:hypothetical protein
MVSYLPTKKQILAARCTTQSSSGVLEVAPSNCSKGETCAINRDHRFIQSISQPHTPYALAPLPVPNVCAFTAARAAPRKRLVRKRHGSGRLACCCRIRYAAAARPIVVCGVHGGKGFSMQRCGRLVIDTGIRYCIGAWGRRWNFHWSCVSLHESKAECLEGMVVFWSFWTHSESHSVGWLVGWRRGGGSGGCDDGVTRLTTSSTASEQNPSTKKY